MLGALVALLAVGCGSDGQSPSAPAPATGATSPSGSTNPSRSSEAGSPWANIPTLVDEVQPSVVSVVREGGEGSGVVWSADGVVVTNHHVIAGATEVEVVFADGDRLAAEVIASDPRSDLAVLRVDRDGLPAAQFADELPEVGSLAVALGNPLGFENSATAGIVSGLHRAIPGAAEQAPALVDLIQTDAPISPGNSGGALIGADGRVIGINVAYIPPAASAVSIGFAIPAPTVSQVVQELLETGRVRHAALGVRPVTLTQQIAQRFDLAVDRGALIVGVAPGGPADEAGVEEGDIVTAIDGAPIASAEDLLGELRRHDPGDEIVLEVVRDGETQEVRVTLGELEATS